MNTENEHTEQIRKAQAKLDAASLRLQAARIRNTVKNYRRQANAPINSEQKEVCDSMVALSEARADELEARAELLLAEAGI